MAKQDIRDKVKRITGIELSDKPEATEGMKLVCSIKYGETIIRVHTNDDIYMGSYNNKYVVFNRFENLLEELNTYGTTNFVEFESKFQAEDIWLFENELGFIIYKVDDVRENVIMYTSLHQKHRFSLGADTSFGPGCPMYDDSKLIFRRK